MQLSACGGGVIGSRIGLKIRWFKNREGSSPFPRTKTKGPLAQMVRASAS
jgi:hypothetical protein